MDLPSSQQSRGSTDEVHPCLEFRCNYKDKDGKTCAQPLDEGWVTACSHLFCTEHARMWFAAHDSCPVCHTEPVKLVRVDLSKSTLTKRGRSCLIGMHPLDVLRALQISLSFWTDQKIFHSERERQFQENQQQHVLTMERVGMARLKEAEDTCNDLERKNARIENKLRQVLREVSSLRDAERKLVPDELQVQGEWLGSARALDPDSAPIRLVQEYGTPAFPGVLRTKRGINLMATSPLSYHVPRLSRAASRQQRLCKPF